MGLLILLLKGAAALVIGSVIGLAFSSAFNDYGKTLSGGDAGHDARHNYTGSGGAADDTDDLLDDFIMPRDAMSIARGENPHDPEAQWKSMTDPLDLFGDD